LEAIVMMAPLIRFTLTYIREITPANGTITARPVAMFSVSSIHSHVMNHATNTDRRIFTVNIVKETVKAVPGGMDIGISGLSPIPTGHGAAPTPSISATPATPMEITMAPVEMIDMAYPFLKDVNLPCPLTKEGWEYYLFNNYGTDGIR